MDDREIMLKDARQDIVDAVDDIYGAANLLTRCNETGRATRIAKLAAELQKEIADLPKHGKRRVR